MNNVCVYSFADATGLTKYVDDTEFNNTGTWSSSGTYVTSTLDTVTYATTLYICIRNNIGDNPRRIPTRTNPTNWSILSSLYEYQCDGTVVSTADAAYALAQIGTNTGTAAYNLAGSAISAAAYAQSTANGAFAVAVAGTDAANQALGVLSTHWNGTVSVWAAGSFGGPANVQLTFINGILSTVA